MKPTNVTLLKNLATRLHPQVLLSQTESKKLLDTLKVSFRNHLDVEYSPLSADSQIKKPQSYSALSYAEKHAASVLTNPLLIASRPAIGEFQGSTARHPITILKDCIAQGTATVDIVRDCLLTFRRSLKPMNRSARVKAVKNHKAGTQALQWLWASGTASRIHMTKDPKLCTTVVYFLAHEGRQDAVWNWIASSRVAASTGVTEAGNALSAMLLCSLVNWTRQYVQDPVAKLDCFIKAAQLDGLANINARFLGPAAAIICTHLNLLESQQCSEAELRKLEQFLAISAACDSSVDPNLALNVARLRLQYLGSTYIEEALVAAKAMDIGAIEGDLELRGIPAGRFLLQLAEVVQQSGTRLQAKRLAALLVHMRDDTVVAEESLLSKLIRSVPSLPLRNLRVWCIDTQMNQPALA